MPRKLCYVCEATQGGVRKHLRDLFRVFSRPEEDFEVHAVLGDRGEPGFHEELDALAAGGRFHYVFVPKLKRSISPFRDAAAYAHIKDELRRIRPDVVHTHSSKAGVLGRQAAQHLGVERILHTPHVFPFQWTTGVLARIYLAIERQAARSCRALICVGESQRANAAKRNVAPVEKLVVVPNGIELPTLPESGERERLRTELELPAGVPVVGMVARLAPQKGVGIFVQAAARLAAKRPETVFVVVGGGPLLEDVRARARTLKLSDSQFRLLGHRPDAERLYPAFDLVVLSSLYEGLPYVLLEAMGRGVPVVATDVLGSRDVVVDGETGFLARVDDPAHIADRIQVLLDDPPFLRRCGQAARERVRTVFNFDQFIAGHRRLYRGE